jgi:hypothetical protein
MKERFSNPQHAVVFRAVFLTRDLIDALERHNIVLDMSFAHINDVNTLRLDLAETAGLRA